MAGTSPAIRVFGGGKDVDAGPMAGMIMIPRNDVGMIL
jgi:hypothetical protein